MAQELIAIIGMASTFPKAPRLSAFWRLLLSAESAIEEAPAHRLPPQLFDPKSSDPARYYTRMGGFIDDAARFDPLRFGVMPQAARGAEPDQLLALQACADALLDAGYGQSTKRPISPETDVILGRGGYIGPGMTNLNLRVRTIEQLDQTLSELGLLDAKSRAQLRSEFCKKLDHFGADTAIGLVPNLTAARVAQRLNLKGRAYTIDAACASALLSIEQGCESLRSGRADLVLAGGVHLVHDLTFWSVFTQLGALSRSHEMRPFSQDADGLLIGEGLGVIVLKRYREALKDGDRVYAVIEGIGSSSDGKSATLMSPSTKGQCLALERAWKDIETRELGLLEAHATATLVGDQTELETIKSFFGAQKQGSDIALGTLKAFIGHTMPASGAAALIKATLSVYHGVITATHPRDFQPHALLSETRLELIKTARAWEATRPRRAAVNAFGFGGSNAHLVLCHPSTIDQKLGFEPTPFVRRPLLSHMQAPHALLALAAPNQEELLKLIEQWTLRLKQAKKKPRTWDHLVDAQGLLTDSYQDGAGIHRVALTDPTPERLDLLAQSVRLGKAKRGRGGLWCMPPEHRLLSTIKPDQLTHEKLPQIAFLYPGVEATFAPALEGLCVHLGLAAPQLFQQDYTDDRPLNPQALAQRGVGVIRAGLSLTAVLKALGIHAQHFAGHSLGEWTGLVSSGYIDEGQIDQFIAGLDPSGLEVPEVSFIAVGASRSRVEEILGPREGLYCSHANCPHQSIFCAPRTSTAQLIEELASAQLVAQQLPFESGFHAPYFAPYASKITSYIKHLDIKEPHTPLWSSTICEPYPKTEPSLEPLFELCDRHLIEPVQFQALIERLYEEGVRIFIQLGVGSLSSFVSDTLRGKPHLAIDSHSEHHGAREQLLRLCGALFAEGFQPNLKPLCPPGNPGARSIPLKLGVPIISLANDPDNQHHAVADLAGLATPLPLHSVSHRNEQYPYHVGAWRGKGTLPAPLTWSMQGTKEGWYAEWKISIENQPYLIDHCFFRQPKGWSTLRDRFPVVPMTLSIQWVMEAAQALIDSENLPERVIGIEQVSASRWIEVAPPIKLKVTAEVNPPLHEPSQEIRRVTITLEGHLSAVVLLSKQPISVPFHPPPKYLKQESRPPLVATQIYQERWMFHGPAYYGIDELSAISPYGIRGVLRVTSTPGALLDNVGQLFGLWVMLTEKEDRVVMPVSLDSLQFFGPPPVVGERLPCVVWIEKLDKRAVTAHMAIWRGDQLWATIRGWKDWRFETSNALWGIMQYPERSLFAELSAPITALSNKPLAFVIAKGVSSSASSREFLVGRCLNQSEQKQYRALPLRAQREWLAGRIAAKDAARALLWGLKKAQDPLAEHPPLFPIEISTIRRASGAIAYEPATAGQGFNVSIAHKEGLAVGICALNLRVGIDLEVVKDREVHWQEASFDKSERHMIEHHASQSIALNYTIAWSAKEAIAKAYEEGLGTPKRWQTADLVYLSVDQGCIHVNQHPVYWWIMNHDQVTNHSFVVAIATLNLK